jgi:hypothetical protein
VYEWSLIPEAILEIGPGKSLALWEAERLPPCPTKAAKCICVWASPSRLARGRSAVAGSDTAAFRRVLSKQRIEKRFRDSKGCPTKTADYLSKVNQAALCRNIENPQGTGHTEPLSASHNQALAIIHEQQIGGERSGQGGGLAIQFRTEGGASGSVNSARTADGKITFSNRIGRRSMLPISTK